MKKSDYSRYGNLLNEWGKLREETTYSIPLGEVSILNKEGQKQIEFMTIKFEKDTHIEDVRRSMNTWAKSQFKKEPSAIWVHLGFYELMPDALFRQVVQMRDKMV